MGTSSFSSVIKSNAPKDVNSDVGFDFILSSHKGKVLSLFLARYSSEMNVGIKIHFQQKGFTKQKVFEILYLTTAREGYSKIRNKLVLTRDTPAHNIWR